MIKEIIKDRRWILGVIAMLTVAPLVAATTLVCGWPECWGGTVNPLVIVAMSCFGLVTVPLWPTYIPAIILTPWLVRQVAARRTFADAPLPLLLLPVMLVGALGGLCVMAPVILLSLGDASYARQWETAGAISGAVTSAVICLIFRFGLHGIAQCPPPLPQIQDRPA